MASAWIGLDEWLKAFPEDDDEPSADGAHALAELLGRIEEERPEWQKDALCLEYPGVSWFTEVGEPTKPAKDICARCIVREECLDYALADPNIQYGIWGGVGKRELERMRREAEAA